MRTITTPCRLVAFADRHAWTVIGSVFVVTLIFGYFAAQIRLDTEVLRLLPEQNEANVLIEKYQEESQDIEYLFLVLVDENLFSLKKLELLDDVITGIESLEGIVGSITPFNLPDIRRSGLGVTIGTLSENGGAPPDEDALQLFRRRITESSFARNIVLATDGSSLCAIFEVQVIDDYADLLANIDRLITPLAGSYATHVAGWIPLHDATQEYIVRDSPRLIVVAIGVILLVFVLSFRTVRALFLPLMTVTIAMVWTVGVMSLLGVPLSIVGIMTPVLIMALGSSYSIHMLNQYYREADATVSAREWLVPALCRISQTIVSAAITTAIGFLSLLAANVQRIRQFGLSTAVGVMVCAFLTLVLFPAILGRLRDPAWINIRRTTGGYLASSMRSLGLGIQRIRIVVIIVFLGVIIAFVFSLRHVRYQTDYTSYFRGSVDALEDNRALMARFGGFMYLNLTLTAPENEPGYFLDREVLSRVAQFEEALLTSPDITHVTSLTGYLKAMNQALLGKYVLPDSDGAFAALARVITSNEVLTVEHRDLLDVDDTFSRMTIQIRMYDSEERWFLFEERLSEVVDFINENVSAQLPSETSPELWGWNLVALELSRILAQDQITSIIVSAACVFLVASITFRSVLFGGYCLVPLALGIMVNFIAMWIIGIPFDVLTTMFSSVAIGAGIDDAIHLLIEFRREHVPGNRRQAISLAVAHAGRPIVLTSVAVITGLIALLFSSFWPIVYFGLLVSMALFSTTVGALVFLPAFLSLDLSRKE